jgi:hypothetical protein
MARLEWITGNYSGKLGASVGFEWRGIKAVRTYAKPKQPNTPAQIEHKKRFGILSDLSRQLKADILPLLFQEQKPLTLANQFVRYNKDFLNLSNQNPVLTIPHQLQPVFTVAPSTSFTSTSAYLRITGTNPRDYTAWIIGVYGYIFPDERYVFTQISRDLPFNVSVEFPFVATNKKYMSFFLCISEAGVHEIGQSWGIWNH